MDNRWNVIRALELCTFDGTIERCIKEGCPYLGGNGVGYCIDNLMRDALELLKDRTKDYIEWTKQVGAHTCATCRRRDCDCPIENEYALPMDGYCHLWDGGKPNEVDY